MFQEHRIKEQRIKLKFSRNVERCIYVVRLYAKFLKNSLGLKFEITGNVDRDVDLYQKTVYLSRLSEGHFSTPHEAKTHCKVTNKRV